jgi:glycosyltransferase involved in cell wall biosynthesis
MTQPLNVLIDGHTFNQKTGTGVSTYARTLAEALVQCGHHPSWLLGDADASVAAQRGSGRVRGALARWGHTMGGGKLVARPVADPGATPIQHVPNLFALSHHRHARTHRFTTVAAPPGTDVLHLTTPLPISMPGVPTVLTIHDLVPLLYPELTPDNRREIAHRFRVCAREAELIVTVSQHSKNDICQHLDIPPDDVEVTYQSTDITPLNPAEQETLPRILFRFGLTPGTYALFVGAIEPKKNLRRLIEAFLGADTAMPLAVVGAKAWFWEREIGGLEAIHGAEKMKRIKFLDYAPRSDLRFLYAGAMFLAFPSLYEGFGLPPLEAMTAGCPVLTSRVASLPEVCGEAAVYVDPLDVTDIRRGIDRMISDRSLRTKLSEAGIEQARKFSFKNYVARLGKAYARIG